ncbi:MAG: DNA mismatch repair protein MutS, partial [Halanaerobiales bacterium]
MADLTPMMQQYQSIKKRYPDSILFFRMGDFYEMFADDAKIAARVLDLALTSRNKGGGKKTPMAGVPAHSAESYIATLIEEDYKVAICEQLEDPDEAKGLVERDVIRVITPGTVIETELLEEKENNYLTAVVSQDEKIGLAYVDISTGEFKLTEFKSKSGEKIRDELDRIQTREVLIEEQLKDNNYQQFLHDSKIVENTPAGLDFESAYNTLIEHFSTTSLAGFGCENKKAGIIAAGEIINFLQETQKRTLSHINKLQPYELSQYMVLDSATRRNLELTRSIRSNKKEGTLLNILDKTITSMGGRLIKKLIHQPLIDIEKINRRLNAVEELIENYLLLQTLRDKLKGIYDLERILSKISYESANA